MTTPPRAQSGGAIGRRQKRGPMSPEERRHRYLRVGRAEGAETKNQDGVDGRGRGTIRGNTNEQRDIPAVNSEEEAVAEQSVRSMDLLSLGLSGPARALRRCVLTIPGGETATCFPVLPHNNLSRGARQRPHARPAGGGDSGRDLRLNPLFSLADEATPFPCKRGLRERLRGGRFESELGCIGPR